MPEAELVLPWDTAYVDAPDASPYIINRSDSLSVADHSIQGPGPFTVRFEAEIDPAVSTYFVWQIATDASFSRIEHQYHELTIDYYFDQTGTYYARFVTANSDASQETQSTIYTIRVTESELLVPNLITPDSPNGSNQVFLVRYKSLRSFEMWIYNRWGNQLFHTKDPSQGWDGTAHGKRVPTGAYYYLIKAEGTDGIRYQKKGDINVLRTKRIDTP